MVPMFLDAAKAEWPPGTLAYSSWSHPSVRTGIHPKSGNRLFGLEDARAGTQAEIAKNLIDLEYFVVGGRNMTGVLPTRQRTYPWWRHFRLN